VRKSPNVTLQRHWQRSYKPTSDTLSAVTCNLLTIVEKFKTVNMSDHRNVLCFVVSSFDLPAIDEAVGYDFDVTLDRRVRSHTPSMCPFQV
jgi:hypothetical protein